MDKDFLRDNVTGIIYHKDDFTPITKEEIKKYRPAELTARATVEYLKKL